MVFWYFRKRKLLFQEIWVDNLLISHAREYLFRKIIFLFNQTASRDNENLSRKRTSISKNSYVFLIRKHMQMQNYRCRDEEELFLSIELLIKNSERANNSGFIFMSVQRSKCQAEIIKNSNFLYTITCILQCFNFHLNVSSTFEVINKKLLKILMFFQNFPLQNFPYKFSILKNISPSSFI